MADRFERLLRLLMMLSKAPEPVSFDDMVEVFGLYPERSESTRKAFERDKASLRELGLVIGMTPPELGPARYFFDPTDNNLDLSTFSEAERSALGVAAEMVRLSEGWDDAGAIKVGLSGEKPQLVLAGEVQTPEQLPRLRAAQSQGRLARFDYKGVRRSVVPLGLAHRGGHWYLVAVEETDDQLGEEQTKTFRVDRITSEVTLGDEHGRTTAGTVDLREAVPDDPLLMGDAADLIATVLVDAHHAVLLDERRCQVVEQRPNGSVVVERAVRHVDAFRSWVLGMRDHAVVLDPPELVDAVTSWLTEMVEGS